MPNKIIAGLTTVGLMAAGGGGAAVAATPGLAIAQEDGLEAPAEPGSDTMRQGPLGNLVGQGVLDETEAEEVREALREARETFAEEHDIDPAERRVRRPARAGFHLHELLGDGLLDADEIAGLPEDSPILDPDGPFAPYLDDGEISAEELDELKAIRDAEREELRAEKAAAAEAALRSLVDEGILDDAQVEQVIAALEVARSERSHPVRNRVHAGWQIAAMLEDGVIDAAELAELPDGHPLTDPAGPAADYLTDGQLTADELAEMRAGFGRPDATGTGA